MQLDQLKIILNKSNSFTGKIISIDSTYGEVATSNGIRKVTLFPSMKIGDVVTVVDGVAKTVSKNEETIPQYTL